MHPILKIHCETGHFSHGYLLIGNREKSRISARKAAAILLECPESLLNSHQDFYEHFFDPFGIEESRDLRQKSAMKPITADKRVFLLSIASFNNEAAINISKIIEGSTESCHFFLIVPPVNNVPSIIRSCLVNLFEEENFKLSEEKRNFYGKFLKTGPAERLNLIKNISGDKKIALEFLNEMEFILSEQLKKEKQPSVFKNFLSSLEELQKNRQFLFDRAPSPRMIIEHFALTLPRLK